MLLCRVTYVKNVDIEEVKTALTIITSCMKIVGDRYFTPMQKSIYLNDRRGTLKNREVITIKHTRTYCFCIGSVISYISYI